MPKSMQHLWRGVCVGLRRCCARAGMMCDHAPTLWGSLINIGREYNRLLSAFCGGDVKTLDDVVHGTGE